MQKRYIAPVIMLIAGAIISICNLYYKIGLSESLKRLLITLVVFYIIGKIATYVISKVTKSSKNKKTQEDEDEDEEEEATNSDI